MSWARPDRLPFVIVRRAVLGNFIDDSFVPVGRRQWGHELTDGPQARSSRRGLLRWPLECVAHKDRGKWIEAIGFQFFDSRINVSLGESPELELLDARRYGDTTISLLERL